MRGLLYHFAGNEREFSTISVFQKCFSSNKRSRLSLHRQRRSPTTFFLEISPLPSIKVLKAFLYPLNWTLRIRATLRIQSYPKNPGYHHNKKNATLRLGYPKNPGLRIQATPKNPSYPKNPDHHQTRTQP